MNGDTTWYTTKVPPSAGSYLGEEWRSIDVLMTDGDSRFVGYHWEWAGGSGWRISGPDGYAYRPTHWAPLPAFSTTDGTIPRQLASSGEDKKEST